MSSQMYQVDINQNRQGVSVTISNSEGIVAWSVVRFDNRAYISRLSKPSRETTNPVIVNRGQSFGSMTSEATQKALELAWNHVDL